MSPSDHTTAELFSAYHDGEVTAAERAEVERLLRESPEARAEMAEISQLGTLFGELPAEPLSAEFRGRVLQATERSMLLPDQEELSAPPARRRSGAVWAGMGGLLATTAAVVLAVVLLDDPDVGREFASDSLEETTDETQVDSPLGNDSLSETSHVASRKRRGSFEDEKKTNEAAALAANVNNHLPLEAQVVESPEPEATPVPMAEFLQGETDKQPNRQRLAKATVGSVIETLDTSGSRIAVVRLTVVDRQTGLDAVRLLLARHRIPLQNVSASEHGKLFAAEPGSRKVAEEKAQAEAAEFDMVEAVFVQADRNRLAAVLDELHDSLDVRGMSVEEPVALADLDFASQRRARLELGEAAVGGPAGGSSSGDSASRMNARDDHRTQSQSAPAASPPEGASVADAKAGGKNVPVPASEASSPTTADGDTQQAGEANRNKFREGPATARQLSPRLSRDLLRDRRPDARVRGRYAPKLVERRRRSGTKSFEAEISKATNDGSESDNTLKDEAAEAGFGSGAGSLMKSLAKPSELRVLLVLVKEAAPRAAVPPVPPQSIPANQAEHNPPR